MACVTSAAVITASPFEGSDRSQCSRAPYSRGRPLQCARASARTSSSRFSSRASSARSRSSTRSRRPSFEVDLRTNLKSIDTTGATAVEPCIEQCTEGLIGGLITDAVDDFALDVCMDDESHFSEDSTMFSRWVHDAEQVLLAGEPVISEESDEDESLFASPEQGLTLRQLEPCISDGEESCRSDFEFDDDACSLASEKDDLNLAMSFAKAVVSDDVIGEALVFHDAESDSESHADQAEFVKEESPVGDELAFNFASDILDVAIVGTAERACGPSESEENEDQMELVEEEACGSDGLVFDYTSAILSGAFTQAATTWSNVEHESDLHALRQKARQSLLEAAEDAKASAALQETQLLELEKLKQKARSSLLQAAQAQAAKEAAEAKAEAARVATAAAAAAEQSQKAAEETLKLKVRNALVEGRGQLSNILGTFSWENLRLKLQCSLLKAEAEKVEETAQSTVLARAVPPPIEIVDSVREAVAVPRVSTPARNRRRIIGGVVRNPVLQEEEVQRPATSSSRPSSKKSSKSDKKSAARPSAICLDFAMESGEEDSSALRPSSISRTYDALGVQFYSLDDKDTPSAASASKLSKKRSKLQGITMSAMEMDLREDIAQVPCSRPSSRCTPMTPSSAYQNVYNPTPISFSSKMRPSVSMPSLTPAKTKANSGGLLPIIVHDKMSADSIAWSMNMSKKACHTGIRRSSSMLF